MKKEFYIDTFKDKKITLMGLGTLGRGLQVASFLAECGAKLTVTDLKNKIDLAPSIAVLNKRKWKYTIKFVLGKHDLQDFEHADTIFKSAGVPLDSKYIEHARSHNIPIAMDASLFIRMVAEVKPKITVIGITGTRGKSMTTALIYHILQENKGQLRCTIHLGGNMRMKSTLPLLKKVMHGDIVVLELDSWQCQGLADESISPHISVFTNFMPDHMNYYKNDLDKYLDDKCNIYAFQKKENVLITNTSILEILSKKVPSKVVLPPRRLVQNMPLHILGMHNIQNAAYAYAVCKELNLSDARIKKSLKSFAGLEGRLQYVRKVDGVHIINDNNATTPEALIAGIDAVRRTYTKSKLILIAGGSDKTLDIHAIAPYIKKNGVVTILLPGTGTDKLRNIMQSTYVDVDTLNQAMQTALTHATRGDVILFSPGFASFGLFKNEYDRNDQFLRIVKKI